MTSVSQVQQHFNHILQQRATVLARETGAIKHQRKFDGAALVQMLVFGWLAKPQCSLENFASLIRVRQISVSDTAVHKRFTPQCAQLLLRLLQEMSQVVVQAHQEVPLPLLRRFRQVVVEDTSTISLPDELACVWQGCGGNQAHTLSAVKLHTRWELLRGHVQGPCLSDGRTSDRSSPFREQRLPKGSLYLADLGYFTLKQLAQRHQQGSYSLTRLLSGTIVLHPNGKRVSLPHLLPQRVGERKELKVLVGERMRLPMRLLLLKVPGEVAQARREALRRDAVKKGQPVSEQALFLAGWTLLLTDVSAKRLSFEEALILMRERWQIEVLFKRWKNEALIDEWRSHNRWRILCELYAKLIGVLVTHWLSVLFAWHDPQRSLVKLGQVVGQSSQSLLEALAGYRSMRSALRVVEARMQAGCQLTRRKKRPNSAQLLLEGLDWAVSWC